MLVLDEIQKVSQWTEEVKRLWDEDTAAGRDVRVVILGSAPLLIAHSLSESMAGRFEITRLGYWRYAEMRDAFGFSLEQFIFYGGYPGAAPLVHDESRWAAYVSDALIETTISKNVLLMAPGQKPALLRRVFDLACVYSGQILSYQKMLGQLDDAGNTTLAHCLDLLEGAGMTCGLWPAQIHGPSGAPTRLQPQTASVQQRLDGLPLGGARRGPASRASAPRSVGPTGRKRRRHRTAGSAPDPQQPPPAHPLLEQRPKKKWTMCCAMAPPCKRWK